MKKYKTSKANRATYRYYDIDGKLKCELISGQDGVPRPGLQLFFLYRAQHDADA